MTRRMSKALIGAAALLVVAAVACTDTTVQPKSTITDANVFTDVNSYQAFLAKIYGGLALSGQQGGAGQPDLDPNFDEGFSQYLRLYWEMEELPTDEALIAWNDVGLPEMNTMTWNPQSNMLVMMYYRIGLQVAWANEFLRQTTDATLDSRGVSASMKATIHTYRAEARFLRAYAYWHGMDLFGSIPLVTEADPVGGAPPQQATRQEIYDFVVSELNAIQADLPASTPANYGRATQQAANMLLAEVYLNAGVYTGTPQWASALNAAQAVITSNAYSLNPVYRNNFMANNNTSPEIIFAIAFDGTHTQTWGGTTFLEHAACGGSMSNGTYGIDGCWWGIRLKPEAYLRYGAGDGRTSYMVGPSGGQQIAVTSIADFTNGVAAPKFSNRTSGGVAGANPTFPDTDFPVWRLSEAYLIYVEAFLRGGGGTAAQALTYFNAIRERAYGNTSADLVIGQMVPGAAMLDTLLNERGRELLWEAHRRTDLIRYGLFTGGTYLWAWKGGVLAGTATDPKFNLLPIPASELVANPNLQQNPGY